MSSPLTAERIAMAVLWAEHRLVLQLRDFKTGIDDPGQWGFFGGHLAPTEASDSGIRRELREELGWAPGHVHLLGSFGAGPYEIIGFRATLDVPVETLTLGEGHELGAFAMDDVRTGQLFSRRCGRSFPLTSATRTAISLWCPPGE
jgi:8-oxo-dGTP pyrophosphatase MutT (NUDIX family)